MALSPSSFAHFFTEIKKKRLTLFADTPLVVSSYQDLNVLHDKPLKQTFLCPLSAMLGDLIVEATGKTTSIKVLPSEGGAPKFEVSGQGTSKTFGTETNDVLTYWSTARPDGTWWGEGQGVSTTREGDVITWRGQGIGRPTGKGWGASWRAVLFYQTSSPKFARLNGVIGVGEFDVDENGDSKAKFWEWK